MGYKPLSERESVRNNDCDDGGRRVHKSSSSSESASSNRKYRRVKHTTRRHYYEEEEVEEEEEEESSESTRKNSSSYSGEYANGGGGGCRPKITRPRRKLGCTTGYGGNNSTSGRPRRSGPVYEISGSAYADEVADDFDPSGCATVDDVADDYVPPRRVVMRSRDFVLPEAAVTAIRQIEHFGHKDALERHDVEVGDDIYCAICEIEVSGKCYGCKDCGFFVHKSCLRLPREIQHESHVNHPLQLIPSSAPYKCVACCEQGYGFVYECSICKFDLDVICAGSPSTLQSDEHDNELKLRNEFPIDTDESVVCEICKEEINRDGWVYFNDESGFIAHSGCGFNKEAKDMVMALENSLVDMELE